MEPIMSRDDRALNNLREHWGSAYLIKRDPATGEWLALPLLGPPADELRAATAGELRLLIRADYDARTLPKPTDQGSL